MKQKGNEARDAVEPVKEPLKRNVLLTRKPLSAVFRDICGGRAPGIGGARAKKPVVK